MPCCVVCTYYRQFWCQSHTNAGCILTGRGSDLPAAHTACHITGALSYTRVACHTCLRPAIPATLQRSREHTCAAPSCRSHARMRPSSRLTSAPGFCSHHATLRITPLWPSSSASTSSGALSAPACHSVAKYVPPAVVRELSNQNVCNLERAGLRWDGGLHRLSIAIC